jgi:hypothetical protein
VSEPQDSIDGARVLAFAAIDDSVTSTGRTVHRAGTEVLGPFSGLVIARYDGDNQFYLFYCDQDWRVVSDTLHSSEESARKQADFEYRGLDWRRLQV